MKNILFAFIAITSILFNTNKTTAQSKSAINNIADSGTISLVTEYIGRCNILCKHDYAR